MKHVAEACHEADLKLIIYYSQPDWHHPDYRTKNHRRYIEYLHGQVRELLTDYGRIDGFCLYDTQLTDFRSTGPDWLFGWA